MGGRRSDGGGLQPRQHPSSSTNGPDSNWWVTDWLTGQEQQERIWAFPIHFLYGVQQGGWYGVLWSNRGQQSPSDTLAGLLLKLPLSVSSVCLPVCVKTHVTGSQQLFPPCVNKLHQRLILKIDSDKKDCGRDFHKPSTTNHNNCMTTKLDTHTHTHTTHSSRRFYFDVCEQLRQTRPSHVTENIQITWLQANSNSTCCLKQSFSSVSSELHTHTHPFGDIVADPSPWQP